MPNEDYWAIEELCDYFSRSLIIPDRLISPHIDQIHNNLSKIEEFSYRLEKECNVTFITSVQRIKDFIPDLLFLNLKNSKSSTRFMVNKSLLKRNKYLNSSVELPSSFMIENIERKCKSTFLFPENILLKNLEKKFPLFFCKSNNIFLMIFRPNDISFMTLNSAQQDV